MITAVPFLLSGFAGAASWDFSPSLSVAETYTDNLALAPDDLKVSEWVTQITPGIAVDATGPSLKLKAAYAPELLYYAQGQYDNEVFHRGSVIGNAELAQQLLFVDVSAKVDQYNVSLQAPISTSSINTTGNRATVSNYLASPYLLHNFGSAVQGEARFTYSVVNTQSNPTLSDSVADRASLRLKSGPAYKQLIWSIDYSRENVDYETRQDTFAEISTLDARQLITPTLGLLAKWGYEKYESGALVPVSEGQLWSAGLEWTPTPLTRVAATTGQRLYGPTHSFDFNHRTRLTRWSAQYKEEITDARTQFTVPATTSTAGYLDNLFSSSIPDPVARQKAVEEFIARTGLPPSLSTPVNFFSSELFLSKRLQGSVGIQGVRNVVIANVFDETRERLFGNSLLPPTGDFGTSNNIRQTGGSLVWNLRLTPLTNWNMAAAYSRNEFPDTSRLDKILVIGAGLTRQIQPRVSGALHYRRQQNDSSLPGTSYTENAGVATLTLKF